MVTQLPLMPSGMGISLPTRQQALWWTCLAGKEGPKSLPSCSRWVELGQRSLEPASGISAAWERPRTQLYPQARSKVGCGQRRGTGWLWLPSDCTLTCPPLPLLPCTAIIISTPGAWSHLPSTHPRETTPTGDPALGETDSHTFCFYPFIRTPAGHHQVIHLLFGVGV